MPEYTAAISAVCLFRQSLRHYWCLWSALAYKPQSRTGPALAPTRSRQLGKNSLRNGGHHHAAPSAIHHQQHALHGLHLVLLLLVDHLHVPGVGSATTAFARVFLFCLHRVLLLGRPVLLTPTAQAHIPSGALRRYKQGQLSNDRNLAPRHGTVVSSVRSSSVHHGLIEIRQQQRNPLFQIFQILQILK